MSNQSTSPVPDLPSDRPRYSLPSANPLPLSASQEGQVRDQYYANVRAYCAEEIRRYADCARGRTFTMIWKCRELNNAMNSCMVLHATEEEKDRAREEWFKKRLEKMEKDKARKAREAAREAAAATEVKR